MISLLLFELGLCHRMQEVVKVRVPIPRVVGLSEIELVWLHDDPM